MPQHRLRRSAARRPASRYRQRARPSRRPAGLRAALLRLCGGALFGAILIAYFAPLRAAAGHARDVMVRATLAGRAAAAHRAVVTRHAFQYGVPFDLATAIQRAAVGEGIDPDLAFRLVRVESRFRERAVSPAGALGLTQLMPRTAEELRPGITRDEIFDRDINLRLGFRYLRWLLRVYDGDLRNALHAYNRGPGTVSRILATNGDPANGYADRVLGRGRALPPYAGTGIVPMP